MKLQLSALQLIILNVSDVSQKVDLEDLECIQEHEADVAPEYMINIFTSCLKVSLAEIRSKPSLKMCRTAHSATVLTISLYTKGLVTIKERQTKKKERFNASFQQPPLLQLL